MDGFTYWYNLGTLQTLRGNYAEARYALEKARYLTLYSQATEQQLETVVEKLAVDTPSSSLQFGPLLLNTIVGLGPMKLWMLILIFFLTSLIAIRRQWSPRVRGALLGLALIPVGVLGWFHLNTVSLIALKPIEVYEGPSKIFGGGKSLPAGTRVLGWRAGDWIKLYDENSEVAWVPWNEAVLKAGWLWGNNQ